jgi:hypothetical protein
MRKIPILIFTLFCAVPVFAQGASSESQAPSAPVAMPDQQDSTQQNAPAKNRMPPLMDVAPETPVVTLEGACDSTKKSQPQPCKTVVTHGDLNQLIDALSPGASQMARRRFAIRYAQLLAASGEAERKHIDADPAVAAEVRVQMEIARVQVLADALYHRMEQDSANVPISEIQKYYLDHKTNFDQGEVRVVSVPSAYSNRDELMARAAKGEDFDHLQQEAFKRAGIQSPLPSTRIGLVRRTALPPDEAKVFDLPIGEVSEMQDPNGDYKIFKLESRHSVPIEIAQPEINTILQKERMQQQLRSAAGDVTAQFNLEYLGLSQAPELFSVPESGKPPIPKGLGPALPPARGTFRQGRPSSFPRAGAIVPPKQ